MLRQSSVLHQDCVRKKTPARKKNIHEETLKADTWFKSVHAKTFTNNEHHVTYLQRGSFPSLDLLGLPSESLTLWANGIYTFFPESILSLMYTHKDQKNFSLMTYFRIQVSLYSEMAHFLPPLWHRVLIFLSQAVKQLFLMHMARFQV